MSSFTFIFFVVYAIAKVSGEAVDVHKNALTGTTTGTPPESYYPCGERSRTTRRKRSSSRQGRILKGYLAPSNDFAFMVAILDNNIAFCSGFAIHPRFVVTNGQECYRGTLGANSYIASGSIVESRYKAAYGSVNISSAQTVAMSDFIAFPSAIIPFPYHNKVADFGLYRTKDAMNNALNTYWGTIVKPICLGKNVDLSNREVEFAGWGSGEKTGGASRSLSDQLLKLDIKVLSKSTCNWKYYWNLKFPPFNKFKVIDGIMNCARTSNTSGLKIQGPCQGDQGGPIIEAESGKWTAPGLFSNIGRDDGKCGQYLSPGIFLNLNLFVDAIGAIVAAHTQAFEQGNNAVDLTNVVTTQIGALVTTITNFVASALAG